MKKTNKRRGFTIVELVIVIAVIAILAAVLIPTFSSVVKKANESAALQEAENAMKEDLMNATGDYANMDNYKSAESPELYYYGVKKATITAVVSNTTYYTLSNDTLTKVAPSAYSDSSEDYYTVEGTFNGAYAVKDGVKTYTVNGCVYDIANGKWITIATK